MTEAMTRPNPGIVTIERLPEPRLTGVTILDATPFGDALQACGVREEVLGAWRVMSAPPANETDLDERTIVINPAAISDRMDHLSRQNDDRNAYVYSFQAAASHVILRSIAMQVRFAKGESMSEAKQTKQAATLGQLATIATGVFMLWGVGESPLVAMPVSFASGFFTQASLRFVNSPYRPAHKLASQIEETSPGVVNGLQKAVLPIYAK